MIRFGISESSSIVRPVLEIAASPLESLDKLVVVELHLVLEIHAANDVMELRFNVVA